MASIATSRMAASLIALACACQPTPPPAARDAPEKPSAPVVTPIAAPAPAPIKETQVVADPATSALRPLAEDEIALVDQLVADEILFPQPDQRARYERQEPETIKNQRHVGFELKQQPGKKKRRRNFHLIDVTVARGGTYVTKRRAAKPDGLPAPNGSAIESVAQTPDGAYDIRVSQGMLSMGKVKPPKFDPERVVAALLDRYVALRADGSSGRAN